MPPIADVGARSGAILTASGAYCRVLVGQSALLLRLKRDGRQRESTLLRLQVAQAFRVRRRNVDRDITREARA